MLTHRPTHTDTYTHWSNTRTAISWVPVTGVSTYTHAHTHAQAQAQAQAKTQTQTQMQTHKQTHT